MNHRWYYVKRGEAYRCSKCDRITKFIAPTLGERMCPKCARVELNIREDVIVQLFRLQVIGRLGRDPEVRRIPSGEAVTDFSVAADMGKDREGNDKKPIWIKCSAWGKTGEVCAQYLRKGKQIYAEGPVKSGHYTDSAGVIQDTLEMNVRQMFMLGSANDGEQGESVEHQSASRAHNDENQLPF